MPAVWGWAQIGGKRERIRVSIPEPAREPVKDPPVDLSAVLAKAHAATSVPALRAVVVELIETLRGK